MKLFQKNVISKLLIPCATILCIIMLLNNLTRIDATEPQYQNQRDIYIYVIDDSLESIPRFPEIKEVAANNIEYTSFGVPCINSAFKAYLRYEKITDKTSAQYKFISEESYIDDEGFLRHSANDDKGIKDDYYLIALGSYYGTEIGTKYRITTDTGNVFYGVLGDCKADEHTDNNNQYTIVGTYNVVEFIVDANTLNKDVKYHGNANWYEPLSGNIVSIEKIDIKAEDVACH